MPYFIQENHPDCGSDRWSVVKADGELVACHTTKQSAMDQAIAISLDEDEPFMGERDLRDGPDIGIADIDGVLLRDGKLVEKVWTYIVSEGYPLFIVTGRPRSDRAQTEKELRDAGVTWSQLIMSDKSLNQSPLFKLETVQKLMETYSIEYAIDDNENVLANYLGLGIDAFPPADIQPIRESRQVNLEPPAYFRASARRGIEWYEAGLGGDGLVERTITEARSMSRGVITADKWVRLRAWIARHLVDMDAAASPGDDNYPTPGQVAMALWGGGWTKRTAERALDYANGVVDRLEAENNGRSGAALTKLETRLLSEDIEIRQEGDNMTLSGYAALFNSWSEDLGGFREQIAPGAFRRSLKSRNDIKLLWNHDTGEVLGSTRAGTLQLMEDERGLKVTATLPPTQRGKDTSILVARRDVTGFSFGFSIPERGGDSWNSEGTERTLKSVRLFEISLTPFPAYQETNGTAAVRALDKVAARADVDADALADAMLRLETGEDLTKDQADLLTRVVSSLSPQAEITEEPLAKPDLAMLALKKKRLELLELLEKEF